MKIALMLAGTACVVALYFLLDDLPTNTRMFAIFLCASYGAIANWYGVLSR